MTTVQEWGRRESIIWPPRAYLYTAGALFLASMATGFLIYLRFQYGLSPLERYYLPYYLRSETAFTHPSNTYRMLRITDGRSLGRLALDFDLQPGSILQSDGKPLPFELMPQSAQGGKYLLYREPATTYPNKAIHGWLMHWIYGDSSLFDLFQMQFWFGLATFPLLRANRASQNVLGQLPILRPSPRSAVPF